MVRGPRRRKVGPVHGSRNSRGKDMRKTTILLPASVGIAVLLACVVALLAALASAPAASAQDDPDPSAGWFQRCTLAKTGYFDPIVHPTIDDPAQVHRHLFVGATNISPTSTIDNLQAGGSTCAFQADIGAAKVFADTVIGGNYSSYWAPDLMLRDSTPDHPDWAGVQQFNAYYKKGASSIDRQTIKRFPSGLKMVIRDDNTSKTNVKWYCAGLTNGSNGIYRERPYDCTNSSYPWVTTHITFPQCGNSLTEPIHMVYANDNGCPKDHPQQFVRLFIHAKYDTSLGAKAKLAIAPGEDPAHADPGTGFHADYFEAWKKDAAFSPPKVGTADSLQYFVDHCIKAGINCRDGDMLPQ